ncbi:MAG: 1,4-alpha-glucan branching protein GlgB [Coraliomargaritaceae bacterium]
MLLSQSELESITRVACSQPHSILGMHPCKSAGKRALVARAYLDDARNCEVVDISAPDGPRYRLKRLTEDGFFEGVIDACSKPFNYRLRIERYNGEIRQFYDPYSFLPTLTEDAIYYFNQGDDRQAHEKMGAHQRVVDGISGVAFTVWAPGAERVSVVGDFNHWDGRYHPMRSLGVSGIWELFIPGVSIGIKYKFEIGSRNGYSLLKTDPYGKRFEAPPYNAAIVEDLSAYEWGDADWQEKRAQLDWRKEPLSIYEMHLGSWRAVVEDANRPLTYRELAVELVDYLREMHYTHVEFMPLAEHPFDGSWGYQVTGFFAPTQRFGSPQDFMYLVDVLHQNGFGVIMDWVPAHFPTDSFALAKFDGSALYEHADPRQGFHQDWGTLIFNYGRSEVRSFLISSALAWCEKYHIDGLRVDAVASMLYLDYSRKEGEWIPNCYGGRENLEAIDFLRAVNQAIHQSFPGTLMIAEESTSFPGVTQPVDQGGLGFDLKWNMGWMHDSLAYMEKDPIHRKFEHHQLSFGMLYQYSENFVQVYSHDEVVHGKGSMLYKMPGQPISNKARQLRALYGLMWLWPGKKTLFMGNDFGQSREWQYDASLDWHLLQYADHDGVRRTVRDLNQIYRQIPGLAAGDVDAETFEWINCTDADQSTLSFLRKGTSQSDTLAVACSFTPVLREGFRIGVPFAGYWEEIFNSDASDYGGLGYGNNGGLRAEAIEWDGRPYSLCLQLPPHSTSVFRWKED